MSNVIDGKALAATVRGEVKEKAEALSSRLGRPPGLSVVLVGDDPASQIYVRSKDRAAQHAGLRATTHRLPAETSQTDLETLVAQLNADDAVDAILVQLPLPEGLDEARVIESIDPAKDVDGLHPVSQGRLLGGMPGLRPCTPVGCMRLLAHADTTLKGARAVVVGRSTLVGKPLALMLLEQHATVVMCHSRTRDLADEIGRADVLVSAVGRAGLVRGEWIKPGAVVIDVGINRQEDGKLTGDVEFSAAAERARAITPVPGGVGPMTIACLLQNTVSAASMRAGLSP